MFVFRLALLSFVFRVNMLELGSECLKCKVVKMKFNKFAKERKRRKMKFLDKIQTSMLLKSMELSYLIMTY